MTGQEDQKHMFNFVWPDDILVTDSSEKDHLDNLAEVGGSWDET